MKKRVKLLLSIVCSVLTLVACSKKGVEPDNLQPTITIPASENVNPSFTDEGGSAIVSFATNANWSAGVVESGATWCTVYPASGGSGSHTLTIIAAKNDAPDSRTATIRIMAGTATQTITVTQKQKDALTVTSEKFDVPAEGGNIDIEATANVELSCTVEGDAKNWISYVETKALKTSHLIFKVSANERTEAREGKITVSGGGKSETITVEQTAKAPAEFKISQTMVEVGSGKSTFEISITSSIGYEVKPEAHWIKLTASSGEGGVYTHTFEVAENGSSDAREGVIVVCNDEQVCIPIKVKQAGKAVFVITPTKVETGSGKAVFEITVISSIGYQVKPEADWITQVSVTGSDGVYIHTFEVAENSSSDARKGVIAVCNDEQACIPVTVVQAKPEPVDMSWVTKEFHHRSLLMGFTSDLCAYHNNAEKGLKYPNKIEIANFHSTECSLAFRQSKSMIDLLGITQFPRWVLDMRYIFTEDWSPDAVYEQMHTTENNYRAQTGISYVSTLSGNICNVNLNIYAKAADKYKVTVLLLEDNVFVYEWFFDSNDEHDGIVRMALTDILGDDCTVTQENQVVRKHYSANIPSDFKKENMRILVYVQRPYGNQPVVGSNYGDYYVDNCVSGKIGSKLNVAVSGGGAGGNEDIVPGDEI